MLPRDFSFLQAPDPFGLLSLKLLHFYEWHLPTEAALGNDHSLILIPGLSPTLAASFLSLFALGDLSG